MKKYKRIMSILMVALFAVGFLTFPVSINAEEKSGSVSLENGGLLFYTIIDDEASVTGYEGSAAEVGIPSEIEGCPVKKLDDEAFKGNTDITRVIIPDGVTEIGNMAFWGCSELVSVTVPDSVTTIGSKAFYSCSALSDLKLSLNITSLGNDVFVECVSLTQVSLPSAVKIGSNTFSQCEGLKKVTLAENLEKISEGMFNECVNLTEVNNFSNVKKIGAFAFYNCTKLPDITFSDSLEEIGDSAFYGCGSFVNVTVPGNVKSLGTGVFSSCVNLKKAKLGNGIKTVPYLMFAFCDSLENIEIPNTVTDIEKCAFWKSKGIIKITLPDSVERIGYYAFQDCESLTEFNIPDKVVSVGGDAIRGTAFYKNSDNWDEDCLYKNKVLFNVRTSLSAESVKVKDGTTVIASRAMYECGSIKNIELPDSIKRIDENVFEGCSSLESVYIPIGVTDIGNRAFYNCSSLSEIAIPPSVESIGKSALGYLRDKSNPTVDGFTIKGYSTSAAETYAEQNSFTFVSLDGQDYPTCPTVNPTEPVTTEPVTTVPVTEPTTTEPVTTVPVTEPTTTEPVTTAPVTEPTTTEPVTTAPVTEPTTTEPVTTVVNTEPTATKPAEAPMVLRTQSVTAKSYSLIYGAKSFTIKASAKGKLNFSAPKNSVIELSRTGKVKVTGCGIINVTIKAAKTKYYKQATKRIRITVYPQKARLKSGSGTTARYVIYFEKLKDVSGYELFYRAKGDKKWKKVYAKKNATHIVINNLKYSRYSIKLCGYKLVGKNKLRGAFAKGDF